MFLYMLLLTAPAVPQAQGSAGLIDRDRIDRLPPTTAPVAKTPPATKVHILSAAPAVRITGIQFRGAKAPAPVAEAARTFLGKFASSDTLADLAAALSQAYGRSPVALYTIAVPEQDFKDGVVTLLLTEGSIAKVQYKNNKAGRDRLLRARMTKLTQEQPLSRATFERELTLARATPGLTFDATFEDPNADGQLVMTVTPKQKRTKFSAGYSNRGIDLLGDGQLDAKAEFYGYGVNGDQLTLAASAAPDLRRYRYYSGSYAAPLTASGLTLSANAAFLETRPQTPPIRGTAKLAGLSLAYPLVRDFHRSVDVSIGIDGIDSDNALVGSIIAAEHTRAARIAASFSTNRERRSLAFSASLSKGLGLFNAHTNPAQSQIGFRKANIAASAAQAFGKRLVVRLSVSGQYSGDRLPATELFSLGGDAIGRAFDQGLLTGDRGAGGLGELAYRPLNGGTFGQSEVYGFVDGGVVGVASRGGLSRQNYALASAGAGFRARYKDKAMLGLEAAHAIDDPYAGYAEDWRMSVSWQLSM
jgi:hemolysin activation/secretion protein